MKNFRIKAISQGYFWIGFIVLFALILYLSIEYLPSEGAIIILYLIISLIISWILSKIISEYSLDILIDNDIVKIKQTSGLLIRFKEMTFNSSDIQDFMTENSILFGYFTIKVKNHYRIMIYRPQGTDLEENEYKEMIDIFSKYKSSQIEENEIFEDIHRRNLFETKAGLALAIVFGLLGLFFNQPWNVWMFNYLIFIKEFIPHKVIFPLIII